MSIPDHVTLLRTLGVYPVGLGTAGNPGLAAGWPGLVDQLVRLYRERVSRLAYVPSNWVDQVEALMRQDPSRAVWVPAPAFAASGQPTTGTLPAWLAHPEARRTWQELGVPVRQAVSRYAQRQAELGAGELARLQMASAWWSALYKVASVVGAPVLKVAEVVDPRRSVWPWVVGLGLAVYLFTRRGGGR